MFRRQFFYRSAALAAAPATGSARQAGLFHVADFGVVANGAHLNTKPIQSAIDACAAAGGGTVYFPAGRYLSGTLFLKSNVTLHLAAGAVLVGSRDLSDYPVVAAAYRSYTDIYTDKSLLYGENLENIGIEGRGTIDGQGAFFKGPYKVRPYMIRIIGCRNVAVTGVSMKDSPMWVQHYLACDGVNIRGITVHSRANANNDGIDIDSCEQVRISDCDISSGDDAIVLKSTSSRPCRNVTVTNCVLSSHCNALKLGTETNGGFENIAFSNCAVYDTRLAGIALEIVDGGTLDRVSISNITMKKVGSPIFVRLGDRARPFQEGAARPPAGKLRNVVITDVQAVEAGQIGCAIAGLPGHPVEHLTLENIRLVFDGAGKASHPQREVPEYSETYPEHRMFGALPAYGFYCRHAQDLKLRNIEVRFEQPDERPALICDDVQGLEIFGADLRSVPEGGPPIVLDQVQDALIHGCRARGSVRSFVQVTGERTDGVSVLASDLRRAKKAVETSAEVPPRSVFVGTG